MEPIKDISPRRSIRNVPLSEKNQNKVSEEVLSKTTAKVSPRSSSNLNKNTDIQAPTPITTSKAESTIDISKFDPLTAEPRKHMLVIWGVAILAVCAFLYALFFIFVGVEVKITTGPAEIQVASNFVLAGTSTSDTNAVQTSILSLDTTANEPLVATGTLKKVDTKAQGTVVIYNNFDTNSQALVTNTRVETSKGLIYRTMKAVTVPGKTTKSGKVIPGSVEVQVLADNVGESYNIDMSDFTIPGFKGTAKFDGFYARSKGTFSGGFSGMKANVSESALTEAKSRLVTKINTYIAKEASVSAPEGTLYIPGELTNPTIIYTQGTSSITATAHISVTLYDKNAIEQVTGVDSIISANNATVGQKDDGSYEISGTVTASEKIQPAQIQTLLAGKQITDLTSILSVHPSIKKSEAHVKPFWKKTFPTDPKTIKVTILRE